jgi:hypothetical protein
MSLDPTGLWLSLVTGGIGSVLFIYGKKQDRWPQMIAGLAFFAYPYFVDSPLAVVAVGIALGAGLWYAIRQGY